MSANMNSEVPNVDVLNADIPNAETLYRNLAAEVKRLTPDYLVGVHSGGGWIARRLASELSLPFALLDVAFHRDDYGHRGLPKQMMGSMVEDSLDNKTVVLIDDVIGTGRTIRAALNELFDFGRPRKVILLVLADRGGRDLPITADWSGCDVAVPAGQQLELRQTGTQTDTQFEFILSANT